MDGAEELPYKAEYAKSGRSSCKSCKTAIPQDSLRLAVMVQAAMFDGRQPNWYHSKCFFTKQRPKNVGDFDNFLNLRFDDQEKIKKLIESSSNTAVVVGKGKKRAGAKNNSALKDFKLEYAKSGRATCRGCELKILKDEIRISKKDFETEVGKRYGGQDMWHHLDCFSKLRAELLFFAGGDSLPGFTDLSPDDKKIVKSKLPIVNEADLPPSAKKIKAEPKDETDAAAQTATIKQQTDTIFKMKDKLTSKGVSKKHMIRLLEHNDQYVPEGTSNLLDLLSDVLVFGALKLCDVCKKGQFIFNANTYSCTGSLTEWVKCTNATTQPKRVSCKIPSDIADSYSFFKKYTGPVGTRIIQNLVKSIPNVKKEVKDENDGPKIKVEKPPLYEMEFVIHKSIASKDELKNAIIKLGGKVRTNIHEKTMAVISTKEEVEKGGSRIQLAQDEDVHVVPETFLDELKKNKKPVVTEIIKSSSICSWGSDPVTRMMPTKSSSGSHSSKSIFTKSKSGAVKLTLKDGNAVDPASELEDISHVYQKGKDIYNVVLGLTDIQRNKNSFYKLQLLQMDGGNKYWLFRSWGRIGTTVGGSKVEKVSTVHEGVKLFKSLYAEKSGNEWDNRANFVKVPGRMCPIDIDYDDGHSDAKGLTKNDVTSSSKLAIPIQELLQMIFDVSKMNNTMKEFELDLEKMPLGKLSKEQLQSAFKVLTELQDLISQSSPARVRLIDASNRFYTLVPHDFGVDNPTVIDSQEQINQKIDMVNTLIEMEIGYKLMQSPSEGDSGNQIDSYYEKLKTEIEVLEREGDEFKIIQEYVKNTHAETHEQYNLEIEEVFKVSRQGESKRYKPFRKLHNRKLLWHGSRVSNYAGILSQGLRIAPPEAPVTGYMFGKGIYFADMVSKSANYCATSKTNPTGLLLLCEVALGNMYKCHEAEYVKKLPKGMHSCKGVGMTQPDVAGTKKIGDVEVPAGKGIKDPKIISSLLYNEFIVYDVAQVNCKYLIKMKFNHKY